MNKSSWPELFELPSLLAPKNKESSSISSLGGNASPKWEGQSHRHPSPPYKPTRPLKLQKHSESSPRRQGSPPLGDTPRRPGEGGQRERRQQQLRAAEEEQDAVHDGFQAEHVGLQQQVIRGHHGRGEGQGHADGQWHLPLAEVSLCTCQTRPGVTSRPAPLAQRKGGGRAGLARQSAMPRGRSFMNRVKGRGVEESGIGVIHPKGPAASLAPIHGALDLYWGDISFNYKNNI